jgi:hypothetical protein
MHSNRSSLTNAYKGKKQKTVLRDRQFFNIQRRGFPSSVVRRQRGGIAKARLGYT